MRLRIGRPAIDRDGLAGDEVRIGGRQENQGSDQVLRHLVALEGAALDRRLARRLQMAGIVVDHAVADGETGAQRVDEDVVRPELARYRPREWVHPALAR